MKIARAQTFATVKHQGQKRRNTGEDYVNHCIRVANICSQYTENETTIVAALLHDTLEDTETTTYELEKQFGVDVCWLVRSLTNNKEEMEKLGGKREYLAARINQLPMDALLIKLADRLDNIGDLGDDEKSRLYREQTRHVFLETLWKTGLPESHLALIETIRNTLV
ncbi:HD domain-containing protein [Candidatus Bathyarchaeota archaeon]|nr:HD domain-containing protein [Candidatus Bathyarchaeota archaeon]